MAVNAQTIEQARKAGYSDAEIQSYITSSPQYKQARNAGYEDTEIFQHLGFQASPRETDFVTADGKVKTDNPTYRAAKEKFIKEQGKTDWKKTVAPYVRPVVEGTMAGLGAVAGAASPFPGGTIIGGALGYAGGKNIMDTFEGNWAQTPQEAVTRTASDLATGAMYEMGGQVGGKLVMGAAGKIANTFSKNKTTPEASKSFITNILQKSAAKKLKAAQTTSGPVAEQAAMNAEEAAALSERIPGWKVGIGQATEDPKTLAMQRRLNMQNDTAKTLSAEQVMNNNQALSNYLDEALPDGSVDDVITALSRRSGNASGAAAKEWTRAQDAALALDRTGKAEAGQVLRDGAKSVQGGLRQQAQTLYGAVPKDMEIDSTPLYQAIKDIGGEFDPAFQRLSATPIGTASRAGNALKPDAPEGPFFNIQDWAAAKSAAAGAPKQMTFGQLKDFRSQVTTAERAAKSSGDYEMAYKLGKLREGVDQTLSLAEQNGAGEGVEALRAANKFYREKYVPTIRQGATSQVLATDKTGASRVENALVGSVYFKPGPKGIEAAESFTRTFGRDPNALTALRDHAAQDLLAFSRNPVTGDIQSAKVSAWLQRHKEAIKRLGFDNQFSNLASAVKSAENAAAVEAQYNKSRFAKVLDQVDPEKSIEYLFSGSGSKDTINTMRHLLNIVDGDKAATNGLKRSFADMLVNNAQNAQLDMAGSNMISAAKLQKANAKYEAAMKLLYSPAELQALKDVQRALEIGARINKNVSGVAGSQTADMLGSAAKSYLPLDPKLRIARVLWNGVKGVYDSVTNEYLARAVYDPELAKQLLDMLRKNPAPNESALRQQLGKIASRAISSAAIVKREQGDQQ